MYYNKTFKNLEMLIFSKKNIFNITINVEKVYH